MSHLTEMLDEFSEEHRPLHLKYPSHLKWGGMGNFSVVNKRGTPHKLFINAQDSYLIVNEVPQAAQVSSGAIPTKIVCEQYYSVESALKGVLQFYEEKGIMTTYPNSIKFILDID